MDGLCEVRGLTTAPRHRLRPDALRLSGSRLCRCWCNAGQETSGRLRRWIPGADTVEHRPSAANFGAWARALGAEPRSERGSQTAGPPSRPAHLPFYEGKEDGCPGDAHTHRLL